MELTATMLKTAGEAALPYPPGNGHDWGVWDERYEWFGVEGLVEAVREKTEGVHG